MARLTTLRPLVPTLDTRTAKPPPKTAEPFYSSAAWITLRDHVRREAKGRCQRPGCGNRGFIVDHIVEIRDGGPKLERSNVELLCSSHHTLKTNRERVKRMRA
jgi:5-methylcytosine-specific restriction endonuclease McrA